MNPLISLKATLAIVVGLICSGLSPAIWAVSPPPDGGYVNGNTAEGTEALLSLTTGTDNTAIGNLALHTVTEGIGNTATGGKSLITTPAPTTRLLVTECSTATQQARSTRPTALKHF